MWLIPVCNTGNAHAKTRINYEFYFIFSCFEVGRWCLVVGIIHLCPCYNNQRLDLHCTSGLPVLIADQRKTEQRNKNKKNYYADGKSGILRLF